MDTSEASRSFPIRTKGPIGRNKSKYDDWTHGARPSFAETRAVAAEGDMEHNTAAEGEDKLASEGEDKTTAEEKADQAVDWSDFYNQVNQAFTSAITHGTFWTAFQQQHTAAISVATTQSPQDPNSTYNVPQPAFSTVFTAKIESYKLRAAFLSLQHEAKYYDSPYIKSLFAAWVQTNRYAEQYFANFVRFARRGYHGEGWEVTAWNLTTLDSFISARLSIDALISGL